MMKKNSNYSLWLILLPLFWLTINACNKVPEITDETLTPPNHGVLEFRFEMPNYNIPDKGLHRVSLSLSYTIDSLYRSQFFKKINVSDQQSTYRIILPAGNYWYQAVITCSCFGDTCLNGNFPGGRWGMKYDFNEFVIINQEHTIETSHFQ